ncbi:hypothetical protein C8J56DRAFT_884025 [Mycena floridula]|nr:hypothetical protein C8J56DRAFT_884025 [Mycena floridula]
MYARPKSSKLLAVEQLDVLKALWKDAEIPVKSHIALKAQKQAALEAAFLRHQIRLRSSGGVLPSISMVVDLEEPRELDDVEVVMEIVHLPYTASYLHLRETSFHTASLQTLWEEGESLGQWLLGGEKSGISDRSKQDWFVLRYLLDQRFLRPSVSTSAHLELKALKDGVGDRELLRLYTLSRFSSSQFDVPDEASNFDCCANLYSTLEYPTLSESTEPQPGPGHKTLGSDSSLHEISMRGVWHTRIRKECRRRGLGYCTSSLRIAAAIPCPISEVEEEVEWGETQEDDVG